MAAIERPAGTRYARPYITPDGLDLLTGPVSGVVRLPRHLDWSGNAEYDLDSPGRIVDLYRTVIIEAVTPEDLHTFLNERTLRQLWALLWLPDAVRQAWESRFPGLALIRRISAAA